MFLKPLLVRDVRIATPIVVILTLVFFCLCIHLLHRLRSFTNPPHSLCSPFVTVANIRVVRPEKAMQIENMILQMAQQGQLREKISDMRLQTMLSDASQQTRTKSVSVRLSTVQLFILTTMCSTMCWLCLLFMISCDI